MVLGFLHKDTLVDMKFTYLILLLAVCRNRNMKLVISTHLIIIGDLLFKFGHFCCVNLLPKWEKET